MLPDNTAFDEEAFKRFTTPVEKLPLFNQNMISVLKCCYTPGFEEKNRKRQHSFEGLN